MSTEIKCARCAEVRSGPDTLIRFYFWDFVCDVCVCCRCVTPFEVGSTYFPLFMALYSDVNIFASMVASAHKATHFDCEPFIVPATLQSLMEWKPHQLSDHDVKHIANAKRFCIMIDVILKRALKSQNLLRRSVRLMNFATFYDDKRDREFMNTVIDMQRRLEFMRIQYGASEGCRMENSANLYFNDCFPDLQR